ncbi:isochorismate synthase [Bacillus aquiflavi]|nr:isochorismate synthase [Bacillus aquiflavi]
MQSRIVYDFKPLEGEKLIKKQLGARFGGIFLITIQGTDFKEEILQGMNRAKATGKEVLLSVVNKIDHIEPLSFFAAGRENMFGERFFLKEPSSENYFIGLGICKLIRSDERDNRFLLVEKEWKRFIYEGMISNPYKHAGLGPVLFGGFSFDPFKPKTELWSKFNDSTFHVPKFMLSKVNGHAYLTTNLICTKNDEATFVEKVIEERENLLNVLFEYKPDFADAQLKKKIEINPLQWKETVANAIEDLKKSATLKKVVLARELRLYFSDDINIEQVLFHLLSDQVDSFIFAFESNGDCFIGASPERLVKKNNENVFSTCLAGSIRRGKTDQEDKLLGETLLKDEKNLIEHQYVVDMIKEAMNETCDEVILPSNPTLLKVRDIQHLYTPVVGKVNSDRSLLTLVERLHPTPALGGLPKKEAVKKIREIEELDRGLYAGPIGWMDYQGNGEFAVAIRSGLIQGQEASLFAGCGVVVDSNPEIEYQETDMKFRPMLNALGRNK